MNFMSWPSRPYFYKPNKTTLFFSKINAITMMMPYIKKSNWHFLFKTTF